MHDAVLSRCLHRELRVCHQKRNKVFDTQPWSTQGDRVPASKLGNADKTVPHQHSSFEKRCTVEWEAPNQASSRMKDSIQTGSQHQRWAN